jgi:paraquat-inducible protein A
LNLRRPPGVRRDSARTNARAMTIGCPECGALQHLPRLTLHEMARCRLCRFPLSRTLARSLDAAFACSVAAFVLLIPANLTPLMSVRLLGVERTEVLASGGLDMWRGGFVLISATLFACVIVLPLVRYAGLSVVLGALALGERPPWLGRLNRWVMLLDLWAMPDVFLFAFLIGMVRVSEQLSVRVETGGACFMAAAILTILTRAVLDRRTLWRTIAPDLELAPGAPAISCTACDLAAPVELEGEPCPRCGLTLCARKPGSAVMAAAFSLAALALYLPANLLPVRVMGKLGRETPRLVIDGVVQLFNTAHWPLGVVVFIASILVPFLKIAGMGWFLLSTLPGRRRGDLRLKTRLNRIIDDLGRWSNIDVFTLTVSVPLIRFGGFASARVGPGATAFALVVLLSMAASRVFDPRLMWDAAERGTR